MILDPPNEDHNNIFIRYWYCPCDECDKPATQVLIPKTMYEEEVDPARCCDDHAQRMLGNGRWLTQNVAILPPWDWSWSMRDPV